LPRLLYCVGLFVEETRPCVNLVMDPRAKSVSTASGAPRCEPLPWDTLDTSMDHLHGSPPWTISMSHAGHLHGPSLSATLDGHHYGPPLRAISTSYLIFLAGFSACHVCNMFFLDSGQSPDSLRAAPDSFWAASEELFSRYRGTTVSRLFRSARINV